MGSKKLMATICAVIAALLYAIYIPASKLLLGHIEPAFLASLLYLGAGLGIGVLYLIASFRKNSVQEGLSRDALPYTIGMIVLDIAAPILMMLGLSGVSSSNASLLNNFEIVATSIVALLVFKEVISKRLWLAILLITLASALLTAGDFSAISLSFGSLFIVAATICWGVENNLTKKISSKNTFQIVILKGICCGIGSGIVALIKGEVFPQGSYFASALLLGFVAFGMSIFFYVRAQKELGAAQTSAFYALAPFVGALLSFLFLRDAITTNFVISFLIMIVGTSLVVWDTLLVSHSHLHTHVIAMTRDGHVQIQTIEHIHTHKHFVTDKNHTHPHQK